MGMLLRRHYEAAEVTEPELLARPAKSGSKADWAAYAVQEGHDVEGLKRDDIVALFPEEPVTPEPDPDPTDPTE